MNDNRKKYVTIARNVASEFYAKLVTDGTDVDEVWDAIIEDVLELYDRDLEKTKEQS